MNLRSLIPIGRNREVAQRDTSPFVSLQREIDRLFEDFGRGFPAFGSSFGPRELKCTSTATVPSGRIGVTTRGTA